jgi:hypothetical protein
MTIAEMPENLLPQLNQLGRCSRTNWCISPGRINGNRGGFFDKRNVRLLVHLLDSPNMVPRDIFLFPMSNRELTRPAMTPEAFRKGRG